MIVQQEVMVESKEKCKREEKTLSATIEKGMPDGEDIVFKYESEQKPGQVHLYLPCISPAPPLHLPCTSPASHPNPNPNPNPHPNPTQIPGDVVLKLKSVPNPMFKRSRDTLSMKLSIPLRAVSQI